MLSLSLCVGVPVEVVERAAHVLEMTKLNKTIERLGTEKILEMDHRYKVILNFLYLSHSLYLFLFLS